MHKGAKIGQSFDKQKRAKGGASSQSADESDSGDDGSGRKPEAEWKFWSLLVKESLKSMPKLPENAQELLLESPYLTDFFDKMRQNMEDRIKVSDYMRYEDPIYGQLKATADRYVEEKGLEQDEAFEKAWEERKYLLKRYLRHHSHEIDKQLHKDSVSDGESIDGDDDDDDDNDDNDDNKQVVEEEDGEEEEDEEVKEDEEMDDGVEPSEAGEESGEVTDEGEASAELDEGEHDNNGEMLGPQGLFALKAEHMMSGIPPTKHCW